MLKSTRALRTYTCSICGKQFQGIGNDPYPVRKGEKDVCCDKCNAEKVIPARIHLLMHREVE